MVPDSQRLLMRPLTGGDSDDLAQLFVTNDDPATISTFHPFPLTEHVARQLVDSPGLDRYFGAWRGDRLVAFTMLRGWNEGYAVPSFGILVDGAHRGAGIGREATVLTLEQASQLGSARVRLTVEPHNVSARRLYRSLGFVPADGHVMHLELPYRIPVAAPDLGQLEFDYVTDALESTRISSTGSYVDRFEAEFAESCDVGYAVSCCNGTAALHLALLAAGVGPGDEVVVPALTYVACANAVTYCGATPVLADVSSTTWTLDAEACEAAVGPRTRAIMAVHLYGQPCNMDALRSIADRHGVALVEDAAEAHGAAYRRRPVGGLGDVGAFSFFGNKTLTTGEGGMVTTGDSSLAAMIRLLRGQGQDPTRRYWHVVLGYNYRLTNLAAAIGVAQLERAATMIHRRDQVAGWYRAALGDVPGLRLQADEPHATRTNWMVGVVLEEPPFKGADVIAALDARGIETRPFFPAIHRLPVHDGLARVGALPIAESLAAQGVCLPTSSVLTRSEVERVSAELATVLGRAS